MQYLSVTKFECDLGSIKMVDGKISWTAEHPHESLLWSSHTSGIMWNRVYAFQSTWHRL